MLLITVSRAYRVCTEISEIADRMGNRPCCRSCRHCLAPSGTGLGWCQLRQLAIHPDLAGELSCHHWMARLPRLPVFGAGADTAEASHQQLSLGSVLPES
jgi:hypothetical protein